MKYNFRWVSFDTYNTVPTAVIGEFSSIKIFVRGGFIITFSIISYYLCRHDATLNLRFCRFLWHRFSRYYYTTLRLETELDPDLPPTKFQNVVFKKNFWIIMSPFATTPVPDRSKAKLPKKTLATTCFNKKRSITSAQVVISHNSFNNGFKFWKSWTVIDFTAAVEDSCNKSH